MYFPEFQPVLFKRFAMRYCITQPKKEKKTKENNCMYLNILGWVHFLPLYYLTLSMDRRCSKTPSFEIRGRGFQGEPKVKCSMPFTAPYQSVISSMLTSYQLPTRNQSAPNYQQILYSHSCMLVHFAISPLTSPVLIHLTSSPPPPSLRHTSPLQTNIHRSLTQHAVQPGSRTKYK